MTFIGIIHEIKCLDCNHSELIYTGFIKETYNCFRPFYCPGCNKIEYIEFPKEELEKGPVIRYCQYTGKPLVEINLEKQATEQEAATPEYLFGPLKANVPLACSKCKSKNVTIHWCGMT